MNSAQRPKRNRYVRFTSNVLRSGGIVNDALCYLIAYVVTVLIYQGWFGYYFDSRLHTTAVIIMAINFFLIRISRDAYSAFRGQGDDLGSGTFLDFLVAVTLTGFTIIQFGELSDLSPRFALIFLGLCIALLIASRLLFRRFVWLGMRHGVIGQRVGIYGADREVTSRLLELLDIERLPHINIIGFADDRRTRVETGMIGRFPYLGGFEELLELARRGMLDQLIVALPLVQQERLNKIIEELSAGAIDICIMPREFLVLRDRYRVNYIGSLPVLSVWQQPVRDFDGILKEIQDRLLALIGILVLSPILLITAIAIKLESKGPILFKQKRFGFNNLEIEVLKFRSMYTDRQDESGGERTRKGDPRVTRVGRIIRRTSIDELPQLFNVLRGEMSIVGPRPHALAMRVGDAYYHDAVRGYAARHRVKPGITGLAQVRGLRGEIDTIERGKQRVEYDIYYIENWSPLLDLRIILETVFKLVWDRHAY
ncbi:undecaprenyl-phosphate glucose phosphotransferase [Sphingobium sp. H33]|uniref:Undecaprenyl-phosphate glucose phosphotransferase n=1 Tax=Sphingobium nicotianae TaxID=2782607 RepID=A0A9X1IT55_9SPHN|nr:undecaprenyl-phosphate glucose phosphotransferase [Sphingobium nicotianae]MBT2188955.1 undecaprenyl-phosphate glucose phosphotransferase [Sphingobium nicotianae]